MCVTECGNEAVCVIYHQANSLFLQQPAESEPVKRSTRSAAKSACGKMKVSWLSLLLLISLYITSLRTLHNSLWRTVMELMSAQSHHNLFSFSSRKLAYVCIFVCLSSYLRPAMVSLHRCTPSDGKMYVYKSIH